MKFLALLLVLAVFTGCAYAEEAAYSSVSTSQVCDVYSSEVNNGVIILVHGGGFAFGTQKDELIRPVISKAVERGYAVVCVDYRKSSEAVFPAALADVKASVRWVKANAGRYGFNTENITIWGESAGAYLSVMTALTPDSDFLNGDVTDNASYSSSVRNLVSFYAPVEFYTMDKEFEELGLAECANHNDAQSFESRFLGQALNKDKAKTYTTYWENYPVNNALAKIWIQAGSNDHNVPYTQSENLAERLTQRLSGKVYYSLIDGAGHMDQAFYTDDNLNAIFDYLAE